MDTCTLIIATTLLAIPCQQERSCSQLADGSKQICSNFCRPQPQSYECVKSDGTKYIWTPSPTEGMVVMSPASRPQ